MLTQTESVGAADENGVALKERGNGPRATTASPANKGKFAEAPAAGTNDGRHHSIATALNERLAELRAEHAEVIGELAKDHAAVADAGDDAIDLGTKTFA